MKRFLSLILTISILAAALALPASATAVSGSDAAKTLSALGLMKGTGNGFELERGATRAEALAMLLRLLGKENAAVQEQDPCPFDDGGWAAPLITYAWKNGLVRGVSETHFGSDDAVNIRDWLTMLLRALGYRDDLYGDFSWAQSIAFADRIGLTHGEYTAADPLLREDLAILSYNALTMRMNHSEWLLIQQLYQTGVVSGAALRATRLAGVLSAVSSDQPAYSGVEIHERFAPAVFLVEAYESEASLENDKPDGYGSGFFITPDGVAVMTYHQVDDACAMRATTLDGRSYDVTGVLFYDALWDAAVVRVARTDQDGNPVSYFPHLDLSDSDITRPGEEVFLLGSALGMSDNITNGLLSNRCRDLGDPDYLYLQHSAPAAAGSSGGPLLNERGEVVGIHFANFINSGVRSETLNLAVPINVIADVSLTDAGIPVVQLKEEMDEKKSVAKITADRTELTLQYEEKAVVMISHDWPGVPNDVTVRYQIDDPNVVSCEWGKFTAKRSLPLTVTGIGNGEATITILFIDKDWNEIEDEERTAVIHVTVTGAPEEALNEYDPAVL